jgi:transcriptional regulator with XRE-family HTH domain
MTAEIVHDLTEWEARILLDAMKSGVAQIEQQIVAAYQGRAWVALHYASWDEMCDVEFEGARLRVPRETRAEQVRSLREAGMSTRSIASALGVSVGTAHADLAGVQDRTPAPVTGQDGKQYAATRPRSEPTEPDLTTPEAIAAAREIAEVPYAEQEWDQDEDVPAEAYDDEPLTQAECEALDQQTDGG